MWHDSQTKHYIMLQLHLQLHSHKKIKYYVIYIYIYNLYDYSNKNIDIIYSVLSIYIDILFHYFDFMNCWHLSLHRLNIALGGHKNIQST